MREGWTYKKLGEVCGIQYGFAFDSSFFCEDDNYPQLIRIRDVVRGYSETHYKGAIPEGYYVENGDLLIGMDGEFNIAPWKSEKALLNQRVCKIYAADSTMLERFIYYQMQIILKHIEDETPFVTVKHLSAKKLNSVEFPVPPLSEQQSIVSELDKINELISLKKAQLSDLDSLAQSIFYDMFGDPITNEKGWEVKKLGDVCVFLQGEQVPVEEQSDIQLEGMVRFLRIIDFTQGNEPPRYVFCKDKKHILDSDEIAIVRYGSPGYVCYGKYGVIANNLFKIVPRNKEQFEFRYLVSWLMSDAFQSVVNGNQYGAALQAIKFGTIKDIPFIQPSLSLQQEFVKRIELIEQQKAQISSTIKDLETLLASRMQYWFD